MIGISALSFIVREDLSDEYLYFLKEHHNGSVTTTLCHGTASQRILDLMGLEESDKIIISLVCPRKEARHLMTLVDNSFGLELPGRGIAFTIPLSSIGGIGSLKALKGDSNMTEEVSKESGFLYELIVAVINHGYSETIMDAARDAGAKGGTVVTAKGTNPGLQEHFFGMTIADEKDIVLILTASVQKREIMRCIMEKAGIQSPAHTVLFSLPVDDVEGLKSVRIAAGVEEAL